MSDRVKRIKKRTIIGIVLMLSFLCLGLWYSFAETKAKYEEKMGGSIKPQEIRLENHGVYNFSAGIGESESTNKINYSKENVLLGNGGNNDFENKELTAIIYDTEKYEKIDLKDRTKIILTGLVPKGAVVKACKVKTKSPNATILMEYDIKIFDGQGIQFQPLEGTRINVSFQSPKLNGKKNLQISHLYNKESKPEIVKSNLDAKNDRISFSAKSFSVYRIEIPGEAPKYFRTFKFHDKGGNEIKEYEKKLATGESLSQPPIKVIDGLVFDGWYTEVEGGEKFEDWNPVGELSEDETVNLYARYRAVYYVYYKAEARRPTEERPVQVKYVQKYDISSGERLHYTDVPIKTDPGYALIGWSTEPNDESTRVINNKTVVDKDMRLFPIIRKAQWITYDSKGGTFIDPTYVLEGEKSAEPEEPVRAGYTFRGWFKDSELKEPYHFGEEVKSDLKLYAGWNESITTYTVNFWEQNPSDKLNATDSEKTYSFKSSETRRGITGDTAKIEYKDKRLDFDQWGELNNYFFHYNPNKSSKATKINADGSTILNVYYDRDKFTISYHRPNGSLLRNISGLYGSSLEENGFTWDESYTWRNMKMDPITGSYRNTSFINDFIFSANSYSFSPSSYFEPEEVQRKKEVILNLRGVIRNAAEAKVSHFTQNLDGSYSDIPDHEVPSIKNVNFMLTNKFAGFSVKYYKTSIHGEDNWSELKEGAAEVSRVLLKTPDGRKGIDLNVYYERNKYPITYKYGANGKTITTRDVKYQQRITGEYKLGEPQRPVDVLGVSLAPPHYYFAGWFEDPKGNNPFKFDGSKEMGTSGRVAYAVWKPKTVSMAFDLDGGKATDGSNTIAKQTFEAGNKADKPYNPQKAEYEFAGWLNKKTGTLFNFEKNVVEDTELIASWTSHLGYRTIYDSNNGEGKQHEGPKAYSPGSPVKVVGIGDDWNWKAPEDSIGFLCWNTEKDGSGTSYYPGNTLPYITDHTVLYAIWAKKGDTFIKYDLNYANEVQSDAALVTVVPHEDNKPFRLGKINTENDEDVYVDTNRGSNWEFLGWTKEKIWDGDETKLLKNGTLVAANLVNQDKENVVYAQWRRKINVYVREKVVGSMSDSTQKFDFELKIEDEKDTTKPPIIKKVSIAEEVNNLGSSSGTNDNWILLEDVKEDSVITVRQLNPTVEGYKLSKIDSMAVWEIPHTTVFFPGKIDLENASWEFGVGPDSDNMYITFINERSAPDSPVTGLHSTFLPYIVLVAIGCGILCIFVFKRFRKYD